MLLLPARPRLSPCALHVQDAIACGRNAVRSAAGVRRMAAAAAVRESDATPLYPDAVLQAPETHMATVS